VVGNNPVHVRLLSILIYASSWILPADSIASSHEGDAERAVSAEASSSIVSEENIVRYASIYFAKFRPLTALDMVKQVPGFQLENNNTTRGIGNALGNLLINSRRPAAKQDQPDAILSRIPAGSVEHIELIRGQVGEIDLRGQSSLINVVLKVDKAATIKWETVLRRTFGFGNISPGASISLANSYAGMDYNIGLNARRAYVGRDGTEDISDGNGILAEHWIRGSNNRNTFYEANFDASKWLGATLFRLHSNISLVDHVRTSFLDRYPVDPTRSRQFQYIESISDEPFLEVGLDMERTLRHDITGKLIFLFYRGTLDEIETLTVTDSTDIRNRLQIADTYKVTTEVVSRMELDWSGLPNHAVQLNMEGVYNQLDGMFSLTDDTGGGLMSINVPGANSKVEEIRGDFVLQDTWSLGKFELEYGLGTEVSRITQSGDVDKERSFIFLKPTGMLTWSPKAGEQTRLQLTREVAQLNLPDFISTTVLEDADLALGNPDIRPATTWIAELSHERRSGHDSTIKATVFHHWIADVLDLLPLSSEFEAPGNIGDGRRWGIKLESTLPLQWAGLHGARLKLTGRWQDSTVVDPVTGQARVLSEVENENEPENFDVENRYVYSIDFRQDLEEARVAWGWTLSERAGIPKYRVNELEVYDEGTYLSGFIETTRWLGIKINLFAQNILDFSDTRERTTYNGARELSPLQRTAFRDQTRGPRVYLTFSGTY